MSVKMDIGGIGRDQKGIIAGGDVKNANLINAGDVSGSYNAIGLGAKVIVNQVRHPSEAEELDEQAQLAERRLATSIAAKVESYSLLEAPSDDERRNPYKSLLSYELEDAPFFYGRTEAIDTLLDHLHQARLTILHADSGSGKSSLLKAGISSRLLAAGHLPLYVRPYNEPPAIAIKKEFLTDIESLPELDRLNRLTLQGFLDRVSRQLGDSVLYIFLDQFEEFFTELQPAQQKAFAIDLTACLKRPGPDIRWVLSMRKEFFSDLNVFRPHISAPFENDHFLPAFNLQEATDVIIEPARKRSVEYEPDLVEIILKDLRSGADGPETQGADEAGEQLAPPQVQLVCYTLFEEWKEEWKRAAKTSQISHSLYQKPRGKQHQRGAEGILNSHLSSVLERMKASERDTARQILETLVTSHLRRVVKNEGALIEELRQTQKEADPEIVRDVLESLVDSRLLRSGKDSQDKPRYELAHDYLLSQIKLDPAAQARKAAQEMLDQEVGAWRNDSKLRISKLRIPADKLNIIEAQEANLVLDSDAKELLRLSREALKRRKQFVFAGAGAVVVMIILAIISGVTAFEARRLTEQAQSDLGTATVQLGAAEIQKAEAEVAIATATFQLNQAQIQQVAAKAEAETAEEKQSTAEAAVTSAAAQLDVAATKQAEAEHNIETLGHKSAAIELALQSLNSTDPEQALFAAIKSGDTILESKQEVPWQTQRALMQSLENPLRKVLEGHTADVLAAGFSADGRYVVTGSSDGTARIWEVESGQLVHSLEGHTDYVRAASFSADGRYVVTGSSDDTARIWEVESGQLVHSLEGHTDYVVAASFSADGRYVVTGSSDETARIWEVESGQLVHSLAGHTKGVWPAGFSADGRYVVTGSGDGTVRIWEVESGQLVHSLEGHTDTVVAAGFSADGRYVLTGSFDATARIWNFDTKALVEEAKRRIRPSLLAELEKKGEEK